MTIVVTHQHYLLSNLVEIHCNCPTKGFHDVNTIRVKRLFKTTILQMAIDNYPLDNQKASIKRSLIHIITVIKVKLRVDAYLFLLASKNSVIGIFRITEILKPQHII